LPADNQFGNSSGNAATLNFSNGVWTTIARINTAVANNSTGIVNQAGGTINIGSQFQGANGGTTNAQSFVNISGGTMNVGGGGGGTFYLASRDHGTLTVSGSGLLNCGNFDVSRNANGNSVGSVGVVNLNGGTITANLVGTATANSQAGTVNGTAATFNFNGGTLKAKTNSATFFQGSVVAPVIPIATIVKSGGAIIDDGGFAISMLEPLLHDSSLGTTLDGGLIKKGSGTLTLTAASAYTGDTVVTNGTLAVNGSLGATALSVANGGTLTGNGSIGGTVTVAAGGAIAPAGSGLTGTLTVTHNVA
jgi:autotransporter-associated beta strand protein